MKNHTDSLVEALAIFDDELLGGAIRLAIHENKIEENEHEQ